MPQLIKKYRASLFLLASFAAWVLTAHFSPSNLWADEKKKSNDPAEFRLPPSTLDTATRRLNEETDLYARFQLLLRWIKIKEEVDKTLIASGEDPNAEKFKESKRELIKRIESEIPRFKDSKNLNFVTLYRELGFRYQELGLHVKAIENFEKIPSRNAEDQLSYGDALLSADRTQEALDAYELASRDPRFRGSAAYKRAWGFMRLTQFESALKEFDLAIGIPEHSTVRLRSEAYRDRIRPFLETYKRKEFDQEAAGDLRTLSQKVFPDQPAEQKRIFAEALKSLVEGFNAKGDIERAQNAFYFLSLEIQDTTEVLLISAPTWIKVYRGRLDHASVERILNSLPEKELPLSSTSNLRAEVYNTAVFYETYNEGGDRTEADRLLFLTYNKYFALYPSDTDADPLRVNFSRLLLGRGDAERCLFLLSKRSGQEVEVEKLASSLEGQCELKYLDQLYARPHDAPFYNKLEASIVKTKVYLRPDLGISALQAFESLARMLIGSLQKNPNVVALRTVLEGLIKEYPFEDQEESKLYVDLQTASAELRFQDVLNSSASNDDKSDAFFKIFTDARKGTEVALKSLTNSITLGRTEPVLSRCDQYQTVYANDFKPSEPVFERCIQIAEHFLNLEKEYAYWIIHEKTLNEAQRLRVGLLELAQNMESKGRSRIKKINSPTAKEALEFWDGIDVAQENTGSEWPKLQKRVNDFIATLKPIKFAQISKQVPVRVEQFEKIDSILVEFTGTNPPPLAISKVYEARALVSAKMAAWMASLPPPADLQGDSLAEYKSQAEQVVKGWKDRAAKRKEECSQGAFILTAAHKETDKELCPEQTPDGKFREAISLWRKRIPTDHQVGSMVRAILRRAESTNESLKARYYLFRALEVAKTDPERARVHVALGKLTNKARFFRVAYALDPSQADAIQFYLQEAKGNPFFERLYQWQLKEVRLQALNP